jgi:hypothetical protein
VQPLVPGVGLTEGLGLAEGLGEGDGDELVGGGDVCVP